MKTMEIVHVTNATLDGVISYGRGGFRRVRCVFRETGFREGEGYVRLQLDRDQALKLMRELQRLFR